jgi:hypothetical protein
MDLGNLSLVSIPYKVTYSLFFLNNHIEFKKFSGDYY